MIQMQQRTAMGAKELVFSYYLLLIASNVFSQPQRTPSHYEIEEKYSCVKNLDIFFDRAVLFRYARNFLQSWPGNTNFDCTTTAYSRTSEMGIIGVIQRMNFRINSECLDYIDFNEGNMKRCGEIVFGLKKGRGDNLPPPPLFISEYAGPFVADKPTYSVDYVSYNSNYNKVISRRTELVSSGAVVHPDSKLGIFTRIHSSKLSPGEELEMEIALTGYKACDDMDVPEGWFNCGYGVCILMVYVNDGVVNCPFGDCRDEGTCEEAIATIPLIAREQGAENQTETKLAAIIYRPGSIPRGNSTGTVSTRGIYVKGEEYAKYSQNTLEEVKNIGAEFKKHNGILERISNLVEFAVEIFRDKTTASGGSS